jgi:hypothetical protein
MDTRYGENKAIAEAALQGDVDATVEAIKEVVQTSDVNVAPITLAHAIDYSIRSGEVSAKTAADANGTLYSSGDKNLQEIVKTAIANALAELGSTDSLQPAAVALEYSLSKGGAVTEAYVVGIEEAIRQGKNSLVVPQLQAAMELAGNCGHEPAFSKALKSSSTIQKCMAEGVELMGSA